MMVREWNVEVDGPLASRIERPGDPGPFDPVLAEDERARWFAFRSRRTGKVYLQAAIELKGDYRKADLEAKARSRAETAELESRTARLDVLRARRRTGKILTAAEQQEFMDIFLGI